MKFARLPRLVPDRRSSLDSEGQLLMMLWQGNYINYKYETLFVLRNQLSGCAYVHDGFYKQPRLADLAIGNMCAQGN